MTVGGDHSIAAGSIAGAAVALAQRGERIGVIWLDAHGDAKTRDRPRAATFTGCRWRTCSGTAIRCSRASPQRSVVRRRRCCRSTWRSWACATVNERRHLREWGVATFTMRAIDGAGCDP